MMRNKIALAALFAVCAVGVAHAQAVPNTHYETRLTEGVLTQVGSPSGVLEPLKGFAKDMPLVTVMRQITPNGWVVKKSDTEGRSLDTQMLVSWQGGSNWVETLGDIVRNYPVSANVNWFRHEITLMPLESRVASKSMIFELDRESTAFTAGASGQTKREAATPAVSNWTLDSQLSLKENVTEWGRKAGYRVVWLAEDYPLDDSRVLSGAFDQEDGPIKQLANDYGPNSRVQHPLSFQFFQNATLVVENWKFEQAGFPIQSRAQ